MGTPKRLLNIVCLLLLVTTYNVLAETVIKSTRLWRAPDNTRIVFDLSGPVKHNMFMLSSPERLIIDIADIKSEAPVTQLNLKDTPIKSLRNSIQGSKNLRLVFDLKHKVTPKVFTLAPNKPYGHRLVVDLFDETSTQLPPATTEKTTPSPTTPEPSAPPVIVTGGRDIIIAIDAGHGGEDPGAIVSGGAREKIVVLQIAKELQKQINQEKGFKAILTRTGDYFIPLQQRPKMARKHGADLFISIHADAAPKKAAYGASVFALSQRGATSETARWLADTENRSDLIGGAGSFNDKDDVLAGVLLDLSMTAVMSSSLEVGQQVLNNIGTITPLHKKRVEQAGFMVLKSPDIPSILVETGFISNPSEAKKLATFRHQQALAKAIKSGVISFFYKNPPPRTYVDLQRQKNKGIIATNTHKVVKGDTLSGIALKYQVSLGALRNINNLKNDSIRIGQTIKIPTK